MFSYFLLCVLRLCYLCHPFDVLFVCSLNFVYFFLFHVMFVYSCVSGTVSCLLYLVYVPSCVAFFVLSLFICFVFIWNYMFLVFVCVIVFVPLIFLCSGIFVVFGIVFVLSVFVSFICFLVHVMCLLYFFMPYSLLL